MPDSHLSRLRGCIDSIDKKILDLFCRLIHAETGFDSQILQSASEELGDRQWHGNKTLGKERLIEAIFSLGCCGRQSSEFKQQQQAARQVMRLIGERISLAAEIGHRKSQNNFQTLDPLRELVVMKKIDAVDNRINRHQSRLLKEIYCEIISLCRAEQNRHRLPAISCLGPVGTFCEIATRRQFGHAIDLSVPGSIHEVFADIESDRASFGVVPVENSTVGIVPYTLNYLMTDSLIIYAELVLPIDLQLAVAEAAEQTPVIRICAHHQALTQCRHYLLKHWSDIPQYALDSNAQAALQAAQNPGWAALCSSAAVARYGLKVLASSVQDRQRNNTSFIVFGKQNSVVSDAASEVSAHSAIKSSMIITADDHIGALRKLLGVPEKLGFTLTRLYSWPSDREKQQFSTFMEFCSDPGQPSMIRTEPQKLLDSFAECAVGSKFLGSYPAIDLGW